MVWRSKIILRAYGQTQPSHSHRVSTFFMILKYCLHIAPGSAKIERRYSLLGNPGQITYSLCLSFSTRAHNTVHLTYHEHEANTGYYFTY